MLSFRRIIASLEAEGYANGPAQAKLAHDDLIGWVAFFLDALGSTARTGCEKFKRIFALRDEMMTYSYNVPNTALSQKFFRYLYSVPRVTINQVADALDCGYQAANRLVKPMVRDGVLVPSSDVRRNTVYDFERYLGIFRD